MQLASQGLRLAHISKKTVFIPSSALSAKLKDVNTGIILGCLVLAGEVGGIVVAGRTDAPRHCWVAGVWQRPLKAFLTGLILSPPRFIRELSLLPASDAGAWQRWGWQ